MTINTVKLQETNKNQFFLTVPSGIVNLKKWKKGMKLTFFEDSKTRDIIIREER
jgi:hypothetical protein